MMGKVISHYKILEKLGEGGMGVVYKAQDLTLNRVAALKFLPHHLTTNEAEQARFLQEAQAASALNHPNVCIIYGLAKEDDQQFIAMEYVEGTTLRRRIAGGGLPLKDALAYALQIGEALQEAHAKGIVHRDVKAENIMVTARNQIKVMDFGIAKLKGSMKLTRTSSTVGTLAYMAPEQIQGGEVDARSDIFSFGIVVFEMLTGHVPFRGEHDAAMMYSILNEQPQSLRQHRDDCPPDLDRIILRALEKDPEDRYQHIDDMLSELRRLQKQTTRVIRPPDEQERGNVPAAVRLATGPVAIERPRSPRRRLRVMLIAGAAVLIVVIGLFLLIQTPKETITSMAVLPFVNVSGDANVEYLSDGFTEGLINTLSKLPGIRMMSSRSVFKFKGKDTDPQKAAQELHVGAVLTGRILQHGDELSISAELINAQDNSHIWGNQYDRKASDLIAVQATISREISDQLKVAMTGDQQKRFAALPTQNVEAYQLFLKGRFSLNKRSEEGFEKAIGYFQSAVALDPSFALAYAGLAQTYVLKGSYFLLPTEKAIDSVRGSARKALELDESIGEAHAALASVGEWRWDWNSAAKEYQRSIELSPNFATGHQWYGEFLSAMGRGEEGLAEIQKAQELDPLSPVVYVSQGIALISLRRYDEAIQQVRKSLEIDPNFPRAVSLLASAHLLKGAQAEAIQEAERAVVLSDSSVEYLGLLGFTYGMAGRRAEAGKILDRVQQLSKRQFVSPALYVFIYIGLGDKNQAFQWLNRALESRDPIIEALKVDPSFDPLRGDQRFTDLIKKVGLPQ
jgi:TolB-like protein/Flp pilus assembly protein TadD/predicted Ser/Thr protein kinase